jgi:uncharacterized protein YjlB
MQSTDKKPAAVPDQAVVAERTVTPGMRLGKGFKSDTPYIPGRREFFMYRDLGVKAATNGRMRANKMTSIDSMTQPTGWHYHLCEMQFVYWLKGESVLEFEDGTVGTFREGDALMIPGGMRHNEIFISKDHEALEVSVPGDIGTVVCERPEGLPETLLAEASSE